MRDLYQELILDHGRHPRNVKKIVDATVSQAGLNPLCGDRLILFLKMDHDKIVDASFEGSGCAISMASASMMTELLKNKTLVEAKKIFDVFHHLLTTGDEKKCDLLGKCAVLKGVFEFPARVKCATLAWQTMMAAVSVCGSGRKIN